MGRSKGVRNHFPRSLGAGAGPNNGMQATAYSLRLAVLGSGFPPGLMPGVMPTQEASLCV